MPRTSIDDQATQAGLGLLTLPSARGGLLVADNWDVHGSASGQSLQLEPRPTLAH
jgi:hypothetical protein